MVLAIVLKQGSFLAEFSYKEVSWVSKSQPASVGRVGTGMSVTTSWEFAWTSICSVLQTRKVRPGKAISLFSEKAKMRSKPDPRS